MVGNSGHPMGVRSSFITIAFWGLLSSVQPFNVLDAKIVNGDVNESKGQEHFHNLLNLLMKNDAKKMETYRNVLELQAAFDRAREELKFVRMKNTHKRENSLIRTDEPAEKAAVLKREVHETNNGSGFRAASPSNDEISAVDFKETKTVKPFEASNDPKWKTIIDAVTHNNLDAVKLFVDACRPNLTVKNSLGQSAAHIAAKLGNLDLIKYLLDAEPSLIDVRDTWKQSIFHLVMQKGALDCVKYLVEHHNASLFESNDLFPGSAAIHVAAALGKLDIVKYLHEERGIDANLKNEEGQIATFSAATFNHLHVIKYLIDKTDANITAVDKNGDNILFVCAKKGNLTVAKYLLDVRKIHFDVDWRNYKGETVVNRATVFANYHFVKYFVEEKHAQITIPDNDGNTPLHEAASVGAADLVTYLVLKGAQVDAKNKFGHAPKDVTTQRKISAFLDRELNATKQSKRRRRRRRRNATNSTSSKWVDVFEAAEHGDLAAVKDFFADGKMLFELGNPKGETMAHIAARIGNLEILEFMLDKAPFLVRTKDTQTNSPLHLATKHCQLDIVKYLLDKRGAPLLEKQYIELGNTVAHMAGEIGNLTLTKYFLEEKGIDVDIRNDLGWTPVFSAASKNRMDVVKYLVEERRANVTVTDFNDDNILYVTAKNGRLDLPRYLLDERKVNLDIDWQDKFGETVVKRAARWNSLDFIKYLVDEKHADIHLRDKKLRTPLHEAACIGYKEAVKYFLERGADPQAKDIWNRTHTDDDSYRDILEELRKMNVTLYERER